MRVKLKKSGGVSLVWKIKSSEIKHFIVCEKTGIPTNPKKEFSEDTHNRKAQDIINNMLSCMRTTAEDITSELIASGHCSLILAEEVLKTLQNLPPKVKDNIYVEADIIYWQNIKSQLIDIMKENEN